MTAYKDEKRGTWFANFRYKDWRGESKQKSKRGFRTKREAQAWERDFKKKMSRAASMEFSLACDIYLKDNAPRVRETTLEQKRYYIEQILKPYFEGMLVGDIDAKAVIVWENHLLESRTRRGTPYTATYLNTLCSQLSAIMNHLVRFYGLERNPVQIAGKVGSKEKREISVWTREQYLRFSDAVADKPYSHIAFEILFWCGLRVGEMLALTPSDIDFETSQIHITKSFGRVGGMDVINPPKTPQSNRVVTMPSFLADEIEEYLKLHAKAKPDARIFPTMTKHLLHHEMTRGSKAAGLKRIRIHDLRHSHATMLVEMGMSVPSIAARLGHSGEIVTHRYLHLLPGSEAAIASKLDTMMGRRAHG